MERYRTIYNSYYHSAHGIVVVYDMSDARSFENVKNYWLNEIRTHAPHNAVIMLVGNKCDLSKQRSVPFDEAEQFAANRNLSLFEVRHGDVRRPRVGVRQDGHQRRGRLLRAGQVDARAPAHEQDGPLLRLERLGGGAGRLPRRR